MDFAQALPLLVSSYRRGELVPFIGAGMSMPACSNWEELVLGLEGKTREEEEYKEIRNKIDQARVVLSPDIPQPVTPNEPTNKEIAATREALTELRKLLAAPTPPTPTELIRRADRAVKRLRLLGEDHFQAACRKAIRSPNKPTTTPDQTKALAATWWPLVVSTNYDDLYPVQAGHSHPGEENRVKVLGRMPADCHEVLESLTRRSGPILWAVQGYLGGQTDVTGLDSKDKLAELARQVVVGHHDYQRVINADPIFRRAFADVFRRRSFLFLGSGLQEDYLVNLFGEILLTYGPGTLQHYAMMPADEAELHGDFLRSRLNVTPIVYDSYKKLPDWLRMLAAGCSKESLVRSRIPKETLVGIGILDNTPLSVGGGGRLEDRRLLWGEGQQRAELIFRWGGLPGPGKGECVALSAGRGIDGPLFDSMGESFFGSSKPEAGEWHLAGKEYVYQKGQDPIFAVVAREEKADARDLRKIAPAVVELLAVAAKKMTVAAEQKERTVHAGLLSAGRSKAWHPTFSLIEMVRGARNAAAELGAECPSLVIDIVDPAVWFPLQAQKLGVDDILAGPNVKFWAEWQTPTRDEPPRLLCVRHEDDPVSRVAGLLGFTDRFAVTVNSLGQMTKRGVPWAVAEFRSLHGQDHDATAFEKAVEEGLQYLPEPERARVRARCFAAAGYPPAGGGWVVEIRPSPSDTRSSVSLEEAWGQTLTEIGVVHGSTLIVRKA